MLGITIEKLEITANTNNGKFSVTIPFNNGLNIIRAENSSGKSTCVNAIAYALGLEAILGPGRKRPFPKSLYDEIYDNQSDKNSYFVHGSFVSISISNIKGMAAKLTRDIEGNDQKVFISTEITSESGDYFLGSAGTVGSAKSERGFHHWLAEFLGWELPNVVTFEGVERKLYLECIFPLFFIEQKRGWSEIQANTPTHYGIKGVKKAAAEFCLGIDSFEHEKKMALLKSRLESADAEWEKLRSSAEGVADFNSVRVKKLPDFDIKKGVPKIEFSYLENDVFVSVEAQERALDKVGERLTKEIERKTPDNEELNAQHSVLRVLYREAERNAGAVELALLSLSEVENKLSTLNHDYDQYQQLRRLKKVGSEIGADLETRKCPICESDLYDTLGNSSVKRAPMTLEENIEFIKNQLDFYTAIKAKTKSQLKELQAEGKLLNSRIGVENEKLSALREDLNDVNGATKQLLRQKIEVDMLLRSVTKLKESQTELNEQAERIYATWALASKSLIEARKHSPDIERHGVIKKLESILRGNLEAFNFNGAVNSITISEKSLRPEQEGYDIVAETSASDYIRIIWSYTLALLELAGAQSETKHGGFVVFDEPRQHEANMVSFTSLIVKATESGSYGGQVIFATSLQESELKASCDAEKVNLICFDDYILTMQTEGET